jgi:hypothetical protein
MKKGTALRGEYRHYKDGANQRGISFSLSFDEFTSMLKEDCFYCGSEPSRLLRSLHEIVIVNGIDRVDNDLGYVIGNCAPCCTVCNMMKHGHSMDKFIDHCTKVVSHSCKQ